MKQQSLRNIPPARSTDRKHRRLPIKRVLGAGLALLLAATGAVTQGIVTPVPAAHALTGDIVGTVDWPADVNMRAGGYYAIAQWNNQDAAFGLTGSGGHSAIVGTTATPTRAIILRNAAGTGYRDALNLAVSANANNNGNDGLWTTPGLNVQMSSTWTTAQATEKAAFEAQYGTSRFGIIEWSPATNNGLGERGKTYDVRVPWPQGQMLDSETCGMETNPGTNELVVMNDCTPANGTNYMMFSPGPDGDPLTLADNTFRTVKTVTSAAPNNNPGDYSDMTIDALGNIYNVVSSATLPNSGRVMKTDSVTGAVSVVADFASGTGYTLNNTGSGLPVQDWRVNQNERVALGFLGGKIVVPSGYNDNRGANHAAIDPLAQRPSFVAGYPIGATGWNAAHTTPNSNNTWYDGAGVEGAVGLSGTVTDSEGNPAPGQTVAIYKDSGDGTALLQGTRITNASGTYEAMLNWSQGVGYVRVVQPKLTTSGQEKNGEVVNVVTGTLTNDGTNSITAINEGDYAPNPPVGTPLETSIVVAETTDLAKIDGNNASVFYTANFEVHYAGSTADLSRNSLLSTDATAGFGPQFVNIPGNAEHDLRIGALNGQYLAGTTDNSHATDDGVFLRLQAQSPSMTGQMLASGRSYSVLVKNEGAAAPNAQVSSWITAPGAANANPRGAFGPVMQAAGKDAAFTLVAPTVASGTTQFSTLRVASALTPLLTPSNNGGDYAALATQGDRPWVSAGEVEDYSVNVVPAIMRFAVNSTVDGNYGFALTNAVGSSSVQLQKGAYSAPLAVQTVGGNAVLSNITAPANTTLKSVEISDSGTGAVLQSLAASGNTVTIPGSTLELGSDVTIKLNYLEQPDPAASTLALDPPQVVADGLAEITATVTLLGAVSGQPLAGHNVSIIKNVAGDNFTISDVVDNGDGSYTATLTSTTVGVYGVKALVAMDGGETQVGQVENAQFTAGAPSANNSTWAIDPLVAQPVGATFTATATVRDAKNNAVGAGVEVTFVLPAGVNGAPAETLVRVPTDASGIASTTITSNVTGTFMVGARIGNTPIGTSKAVTWTAGAGDPDRSELTVSTGTRVADGVATHSAATVVRDAGNNLVPGAAVTFELPTHLTLKAVSTGTLVSGAIGSSGTIVLTANDEGIARITVSSTVAASYDIAAVIGGVAVAGSPATVTYVPGKVSATHSSWEITPSGPIVAGENYQAVVTTKDANGNIITSEVRQVKVATAAPSITINGSPTSSTQTAENGSATFNITSPVTGIFDVTATIYDDLIGGDVAIGTKPVQFIAGLPDPSKSMLETSSGNVQANGAATHSAKVVVRDSLNNRVGAGIEVFIDVTPIDATIAPAAPYLTNAQGEVEVRLRTDVAQTYTVSASIAEGAVMGSPQTVNFVAGAPDASRSSWTVTPTTTQQVGEQFVASVTVRDTANNLVEGAVVTFGFPEQVTGSTTENLPNENVRQATTDSDGKAVFYFSSQVAWTPFSVTANIGSDPIGTPSELTFTAGAASLDTSTIESSRSILDVGVETSTITVKLRDQFNNYLREFSGTVAIVTSSGSVTQTAQSTATGQQGTWTATLSGTSLDIGSIAVLSFTVDGNTASNTAEVEFVDETAPNPPVISSTTRGVVTGTAEPGSMVNIYDESDVLVCQTTASTADGSFTCPDASAPAGSYLEPGSYEVTATDASGNESNPTPATVFPADATKSTWEITPASPITVGSTYTATVLVRDSENQPYGAGALVRFVVPAGVNGYTTETIVERSTGSDSQATLELQSDYAASYTVSARLGTPTRSAQVGSLETVVWLAGAGSLNTSTFAVSTGTRVANNTATHNATATVIDTFGNLVANADVTFNLPQNVVLKTVSDGTLQSGSVGSTGPIVVRTNAAGLARITFSTLVAGTYGITADIAAGVLTPEDLAVEFVAGPVSALHSTWVITPPGPVAAGGQYAAVVTARDANGNVVNNAVNPVVISTADTSVMINGQHDSATLNTVQGEASFALTSDRTGTYQVTATIYDNAVGGVILGTKSIVFSASAVSAANSSLVVSGGVVEANGVAQHSATVTVRDALNNRVGAGVPVELTLPVGITVSPVGPYVTNASGQVVVTMASTVANAYGIEASVSDGPVTGSPATVRFGSGAPDAANSTWIILEQPGTLAVGNNYTAQVTLRDVNNNLVPGGQVTFGFPEEVNDGSGSGVATTNSAGVATYLLSSELAWEEFLITANVGSNQIGDEKPIEFVAGAASAEHSTISAAPTTINVPSQQAVVTVQLKDAYGNNLHASTAQVRVVTDRGVVTQTTPAVNDSGTYTASLSGAASQVGQIATLGFTLDDIEGANTVTVNFVDQIAPVPPVVGSTTGGVIHGTAEPGSTVKIYDDENNVVCTTVATSAGVFECPDGTDPDQTHLSGGSYDITATDPSGNESSSTPATVTNPPTVESTDNGVISGTGEPGSTVEIRDPGTGEVTCSATVAQNGTWSCGPVGPGDHEVVQIGPSGESPGVEVTVTAPPTVESTDGGVISGTGNTGDKIEIRDPDSGDVICETIVTSEGNWSCGPLEPGDYEVVQIGPNGESPGVEVIVTRPPTVESTDGGVISGTGDPGAEIVITDGSGQEVCTAVVGTDGKWSCGPLGPGDYEVAQQGPDGKSPGVDAKVAAPPTVESTDGGVISGTGDPGNTVEVRDPDSGAVVCTTEVDTDGKWSCGPIPDGNYTVVQIDKDGRESAGVTIRVQTAAASGPTKPSLTTTGSGSLIGLGSLAVVMALVGGIALLITRRKQDGGNIDAK